MNYELLQLPQAKRQLRHLRKTHHPLTNPIIEAIKSLAENPRPSKSEKLVNRPEWRIRVGDYRVLYLRRSRMRPKRFRNEYSFP
jgi:mRNA interferase RelE/StbE